MQEIYYKFNKDEINRVIMFKENSSKCRFYDLSKIKL